MQKREKSESSDDQLQWLGYELHDGLVQWVVGASMQLEALEVEAAGSSIADSLTPKIQAIQRSLQAANEEARQLIGFLEQRSVPRGESIGARIVSFVALLDSQSLADATSIQLSPSILDWEMSDIRIEWNVLRIVQQAISNAVKHAGPCSINVERNVLPTGQQRISVKDDGIGFEEPVGVDQHFGLAAMKHRAQLIGADLKIESQPGLGTAVVLTTGV